MGIEVLHVKVSHSPRRRVLARDAKACNHTLGGGNTVSSTQVGLHVHPPSLKPGLQKVDHK